MSKPLLTNDEVIAAVKEHGSPAKAAAALGMNRRGMEQRMKRMALSGYSPDHDMTHAVPDGFTVKGVSSYYDRDGNLKGQWVKSREDAAWRETFAREFIAAFMDELPKLPKRAASKQAYQSNLMACYPIGDPHVGMMSWAQETGQDWDLAIAERVHCGVIADLVERAPATEWATIVNLGDLFHYDSLAPVTPRSGHMLDADGRYAKMIHIGVKIIRQCIETALTKHKKVRVINAPGNHDETGALFLSVALAHIYDKEPRVIIDSSPSLFTYFEFGRVLVGVHHGHTCKPAGLAGVMAADRPEAWGRAKHRYWWTGHIHTEIVREYPGVLVESFSTLAVRDAYATNGGWRSREQSKCILLHAELGEVSRLTSHPAMLKDAA